MQVGDRVNVKERGKGFVSGWSPFENRYSVRLDAGGGCMASEEEMSFITVTVIEGVVNGAYLDNRTFYDILKAYDGKRIRLVIEEV